MPSAGGHGPVATATETLADTPTEVARAYAPYVVIIAIFSIANITAVKDALAKEPWTYAFSWPGLVLMVGGRCLGSVVDGSLLEVLARGGRVQTRVPALGFGLLPQGELALGLAVALVAFAPTGSGVLEAVVVAIALHQVVGQLWLRRILFPSSAGGSP